MEDYKKEFIDFMLECQVLKFGSFTLKSGRQSPFFMNAGAYVTGSQLARLGEYYAKAIHDNFGDDFDVLFGPAYKGIPLAVSAVVALSNKFGIDVSAWQGDVDYKAVRDAGCSFVIVRAGYYYSQLIPDDYFSKNLKNAAAAGLDIGVYFYTTDRTEEGVREHVRWIAEQLDGQKLDLPIAFDWEEFAHFQQYGISIRDLNDVYAAFADEVRKQGYQPMLYSSKIFLDTVWSERSKAAAPVWLAHYVDETTYTGEYAIWQESAYGRIPGIDGDVDMNIQYLKQKIN